MLSFGFVSACICGRGERGWGGGLGRQGRGGGGLGGGGRGESVPDHESDITESAMLALGASFCCHEVVSRAIELYYSWGII